jgi:hypothetical protein
MALNLKVTFNDALTKFARSNLIAPQNVGFTASGLPQTAPYIEIREDPSATPRTKRQIIWHLNSSIINTDDASGTDAVKQTISAIVSGASQAAVTAVGGGIPNPSEIVDTTFRTIGTIETIWTRSSTFTFYNLNALPVVFENRTTPLNLTAKLKVDAFALVNDPDDSGNKAWFEADTLTIEGNDPCKPIPETWDPDAAPPTDATGRRFMRPGNEYDFVVPMEGLVRTCTHRVDADSTTVSFKLSVTSVADDTVVVVIQSIELELIVEPIVKEDRRRHQPDNKPPKPR